MSPGSDWPSKRRMWSICGLRRVEHVARLVALEDVVGVGEPVAGVAVGLQPADGVGQRVHRVSIHLS